MLLMLKSEKKVIFSAFPIKKHKKFVDEKDKMC